MARHVPAPPKDLNGARVTVMGLGRFGGGVGVTRWLASEGARVLVTDTAPAGKLERSLGEIADLIDAGAVELRLGEHREEDFTRAAADVVVANPAVARPWENRFLKAATASGVPITTEIRLLVERLPNRERTIGVTGTAGKSTTAAMIDHVLGINGPDCYLGGNIGGSLLETLENVSHDEFVVLELSSAQLHWLREGEGFPGACGWSPHIAVVTNVASNHLDWHGTLEHYVDSKRTIVRDCRLAVVWDEDTAGLLGCGSFSLQLHVVNRVGADHGEIGERLDLPGLHNRQNAALAVCAAELAGVRRDRAIETLASFTGLSHRLEYVGECGGVSALNDSKCTTPGAAALAVGAFEEEGECGAEHVHLICGGYDKRIDLAPMVEAAVRCTGVYTIGVTGPAIAAAVRAKGGNAVECGELAVAVERAVAAAVKGDVILLSPGCASWDQFENYEERGEAFKRLVGEAMGM